MLVLLIWPQAASYNLRRFADFSGQPGHAGRMNAVAAIMIRTAPALVLLYHAKIFGVSQGRGFREPHRSSISAPPDFGPSSGPSRPQLAEIVQHHQHIVKFDPPLLAFGVATFIAAHVMGEAQRIADENASIL